MNPALNPTTEPSAQPYETSRYASLVLNLGRALHRVGSPAHRLETAMQVMADRLGLQAEFFSTPTVLMVTLGDGSRQQTYLARVEPGGPNLAKLADLTDVMIQLEQGQIDPEQADHKVKAIDQRPPQYGGLALLMAFVLVSAGVGALVGGGMRELLLGATLGSVTGLSVIGLTQFGMRGRPELLRLLTPLAAMLVTFIGTLWCGHDGQTALMPSIIAGIIALIPGMDLTVSARELATGHMVSGAARAASTVMIFALLTFGLMVGGSLAQWLIGPVDIIQPTRPPAWLMASGFGLAALGFTVLFQAHWRDWIWMLLACLITSSSIGLGQSLESPVMAAFIGGLAVGLAGNLFARW
ncbi:MAG: threonine/serine exporter family protein, partial [Pseudomonadota bacterium]